ncbi:uncharacterized protein YcbX [Streptacidiphilus sp. MAP12-20]|uniref:MOSC domain-containing protein n=1 Tax=Streptacidiphilus sp. MAP12-20 TaxID=3156299 RepID=UPI003518A78C
MTLGTVAVLRRYPVKSMLGEEVALSAVSRSGLAGDRGLALIDRATGKVVSAKNPRVWRDMLSLAAELPSVDDVDPTSAVPAAVRITLPDGKLVWSTDPDVDAVLSELLGRAVTLTDTPPADPTLDRARPDEVLRDGIDTEVAMDVSHIASASPEGTFFDFAPIHLLTTATLDRIAELSRNGAPGWARYRPNLVIRTADAAGFVENGWMGRELRVGTELTLRVVARSPRCAVPTLAHGDLPRDTDALRVLGDHNRVKPLDSMDPLPCAGVYAQVVHPGTVRLGDTVRDA